MTNKNPKSVFVLSASYTDKGGNNIKALTGNTSFVLRSNYFTVTGKEKVKGFSFGKINGLECLLLPKEESWFALDSIDCTDVGSVTINTEWQSPLQAVISFEVRLDAANGKLIGNGVTVIPIKDKKAGTTKILLEKITDGSLHKLYFMYKPKPGNEKLLAGISGWEFNGK